MATQANENVRTADGRADVAESVLRTVDMKTTKMTGISIFHVLSIASIGASIALFLSGRRMEGIFVGLWPPTFEALKSAASRRS